jgi:hypothetical protein
LNKKPNPYNDKYLIVKPQSTSKEKQIRQTRSTTVVETSGSADQLETSDPPTTYDQLAYSKDLKLHYKLQSTIDQAWGLVKLAVEPVIRERAKEHLSSRDYYN